MDLLTRCFQHNPNDRPTAAELMEHAWFSGTLQVCILLLNTI